MQAAVCSALENSKWLVQCVLWLTTGLQLQCTCCVCQTANVCYSRQQLIQCSMAPKCGHFQTPWVMMINVPFNINASIIDREKTQLDLLSTTAQSCKSHGHLIVTIYIPSCIVQLKSKVRVLYKNTIMTFWEKKWDIGQDWNVDIILISFCRIHCCSDITQWSVLPPQATQCPGEPFTSEAIDIFIRDHNLILKQGINVGCAG